MSLRLVEEYERVLKGDDFTVEVSAEDDAKLTAWRNFIHLLVSFVSESYRRSRTDPDAELMVYD